LAGNLYFLSALATVLAATFLYSGADLIDLWILVYNSSTLLAPADFKQASHLENYLL